MKGSRIVSFLLAALMALLSPGTQAWAQAVRFGAEAGAKPLPVGAAGVALALSAQTVPGANVAPLSLGLSLPSVSRTAVSAGGSSLQARARSGALVSRALPAKPALTAPAQARADVPLVPARAKLADKTAALAQGAAPLLKSISSPEASPDALRGGGSALQDILEGAKASEGAATELQPDPAAPAEPRRSGLDRSEGSGEASAAARHPIPAPEPAPAQIAKFHFYSAGIAAVKVAIETLNLAVPVLILSQVHAAAAVSALYLSAELASLFAGLLGGALVDRIGAGRSMVMMAVAQMAAIAALPAAFASGGALAMPAVYALFILNGVAGEIFEVARRSELPQIVGRDEGLLRKYNGSLYVRREIAATAGVFAAGWILNTAGAMTTIWVHPAFCLAAVFALLRFWKDGGRRSAPQAVRASEEKDFKLLTKAWMADVVRGAKIVILNKKLRSIVLVNIPLNAVHKLFHTLIALIYATKILGNPAMAAVLLGAWNLGELAGAWYLERRGPESRISSWLRFAAAASLSMWLYWLFPTAFVAIPVSFLLAAAMIGNEIGTASFMQASVPERDLGSVTGFVYAFACAVSMVALFFSGLLFDALSPSAAFLAMAALFTVVAPIYFLTSRSFHEDKMPGDSVPMDD